MVTVSASVGRGQTNVRSDVAIVQAALKLLNANNGRPYLGGNIDGGHGPQTQAAIDAFQAEHIADAAPAPAGTIQPSGATLTAMANALPADLRDLRALPGQRTVYLGRPIAEATTSAMAVRNNAGLRQNFRARVAQLIEAFHTSHGLVLSLTNTGARRTFAEQALIRPPSSYAGPGESNHQFGNAVDLGFNGTIWLRPDGTRVTDNHWLANLERTSNVAASAFWDARDALALRGPYSFFRLNFERIHLQDFNGATTSAGRSLAAHLTRSGNWRWQTGHYDRANRDWHYQSDLGGTTGSFVTVGTANQIFAGTATVSAAEITQAGWIRPTGATATTSQPTTAATPPITLADIAVVRTALQADFIAADGNWAAWVPVP